VEAAKDAKEVVSKKMDEATDKAIEIKDDAVEKAKDAKKYVEKKGE
jgi:hypothetical protein